MEIRIIDEIYIYIYIYIIISNIKLAKYIFVAFIDSSTKEVIIMLLIHLFQNVFRTKLSFEKIIVKLIQNTENKFRLCKRTLL